MSENNAERERILQHVLSKKTGTMRVGIYATEVCQVCGKLGSFDG